LKTCIDRLHSIFCNKNGIRSKLSLGVVRKIFAAFSGRIKFFEALVLLILRSKINKTSASKNILGLCKYYFAAVNDGIIF